MELVPSSWHKVGTQGRIFIVLPSRLKLLPFLVDRFFQPKNIQSPQNFRDDKNHYWNFIPSPKESQRKLRETVSVQCHKMVASYSFSALLGKCALASSKNADSGLF